MFEFMKTAEAKPLRIENAWEEGLKFLERDEYNRAWLAAMTIGREAPESVKCNLLYALVNYRKAVVLESGRLFADCREYCKKVLNVDPGNKEALDIQEKADRASAGFNLSEECDRALGRQAIAFKDCQIGYHPESAKSIVVWTMADAPSGKFQILDAIAGKSVYEGALKRYGAYAWKRWWWLADFSPVKKEGSYILRVLFSDGLCSDSHAFAIERQVYVRMLRLSFDGYFNHRCGQKLPWRDGCNDGPIAYRPAPDSPRIFDPDEDHLQALEKPALFEKGWHDGGNWERHSTNMITNLYCLLLGHELAPQPWYLLGGPLPDALEEARYGAEFFLSAVDEEGNANISTYVSGIKQADDGRYFLTRLYLACQDPKIHHYYRHPGRTAWIPWYTRLFAAGVAKFGLLVMEKEPETARRCIEAAIRMHRFYREPDPGETFTMSVEAALVLSALCLARFTGEKEYRQETQRHIEKVLQFQDEDGFFPACGVEASAIYLAGFFPQIALYEYACAYPDDPLRIRIERSFRSFMPWVEKLTSISPFGHMMEYTRENPRNLITAINGHGTNAYFGYTAVVCLLANRLLHTDRYTEIAERQVQWLFGRNPAGVSFMGGSGYRSASQHLADLFDNKLGLKQIPGFVPLGLRGIEIAGLGKDFPFFLGSDVDGYGQGYSISWSTCEGGGMTEGPVNAALALLSVIRDHGECTGTA